MIHDIQTLRAMLKIKTEKLKEKMKGGGFHLFLDRKGMIKGEEERLREGKERKKAEEREQSSKLNKGMRRKTEEGNRGERGRKERTTKEKLRKGGGKKREEKEGKRQRS